MKSVETSQQLDEPGWKALPVILGKQLDHLVNNGQPDIADYLQSLSLRNLLPAEEIAMLQRRYSKKQVSRNCMIFQ